MTFDSKLFSIDSRTRNLCAEISTLQANSQKMFAPPKYITVKYPDGIEKDFGFNEVDYQEDEIAGWRYRELNGPLEMLVIND